MSTTERLAWKRSVSKSLTQTHPPSDADRDRRQTEARARPRARGPLAARNQGREAAWPSLHSRRGALAEPKSSPERGRRPRRPGNALPCTAWQLRGEGPPGSAAGSGAPPAAAGSASSSDRENGRQPHGTPSPGARREGPLVGAVCSEPARPPRVAGAGSATESPPPPSAFWPRAREGTCQPDPLADGVDAKKAAKSRKVTQIKKTGLHEDKEVRPGTAGGGGVGARPGCAGPAWPRPTARRLPPRRRSPWARNDLRGPQPGSPRSPSH